MLKYLVLEQDADSVDRIVKSAEKTYRGRCYNDIFNC